MIDVEVLLDQIRQHNPLVDDALVRKAYAYGKEKHKNEKRKSGDPYFSHPIAVAMILANQKLDDATIVTALLHDTIEDTEATYDELRTLFGEEIANLVHGVTKLTNLELSSIRSKQAENFRKLLLAMSKDLRVLLVKLADRLHNMRTIRHMPIEKQTIKAHETMDIFAPLAGRMGMQEIRDDLEDWGFRILNPEARNSIMRRFITLRDHSGDIIPSILADIRAVMNEYNIEASISGREKKPYSVWRKMEEKKQGFSKLSDIFGFRILVDSQADAYQALGAVHMRWTAMPGRFKDYISAPKSNGYRSIHTTVLGRDGQRVEIQIRTHEMHQIAEVGIAAHWAYREGKRVENRFTVDPLSWLRKLADRVQEEQGDSEEFFEHMKLDMFADQVFCFTPKGDVIQLPRGATPVDFAYAIHTNIGEACFGCKIDDKRMPLSTRLRNGQSVEIQTAAGHRPQATWIDFVGTGRAKSAIRRALRDEKRENAVALGRELARIAFEHVGKSLTDKVLNTAAKKLALKDANILLAKLGLDEISGMDLVHSVYPKLSQDGAKIDNQPMAKIVGLEDNQVSRVASCCQPMPGERIVGIGTKGKGVMVHSIYCPNLEKYENRENTWIDLSWTKGRSDRLNVITLEVTMAHYSGVLGRICTLVAEQEGNIVNMIFSERSSDFYRIAIDIEIRDLEHLTNVITALEADSDVAQVVQLRRAIAKTKSGLK